MISGNCNRSPQYTNAMAPPGGAQRYNPQSFIQQQQQQQQHPHLLFMAGGSVRAFPQMSRGFSMMPSRGVGGVGTNACHPIVQCSMQQNGFGNYGYHTSPAPMFQQHHIYPQPQVIHHQHPQYIPQQYIAPPPAAANRTEPTSGFINGIKNMVKGIINPLNCDFYTDHHKYYNPKYRNNYMRDIKSENLSCKPPPHQPEPHVQAVVIGLDMDKRAAAPKMEEKPKQLYQDDCPKKNPIPEVVAIFSSEDFPELPAPRRSRSATPAKTESTTTTPTPTPTKQTESTVVGNNENNEKEASSLAICKQHPPPKGTFFEIMCTTVPSGRRPTFGGRLKVVPPPFSLNKSPRSLCRRRQESNSNTSTIINEDCDIEEDSFVIFPNTNNNNERPEQCVFASIGRRPPRQRQISECSDDSFVVFFTEDADCLGELECVDDDDDDDEDDDSDEETSSEEEDSFYDSEDEDEDDDDDEEDQDNGIDCVDSGFSGTQNKTDRNKCENEENTTKLLSSQQIPTCNGVVVPREHKQLDSGFDEKKVTFDPHPVVHVMHAWNFAYRSARKGHWEDFARDRERFQKRIERTSVYLNSVLTPEHREKIYHSRFSDDATNQTQQPQQQKRPKTTTLNIVGSLLHQASASRSSDDNQRIPKLAKIPDCANF